MLQARYPVYLTCIIRYYRLIVICLTLRRNLFELKNLVCLRYGSFDQTQVFVLVRIADWT